MKNEIIAKDDSITFDEKNFNEFCDHVAGLDPDLGIILEKYDYPPMWTRPNTFKTLIHIILEQQVSLASAMATLIKLETFLGDITPAAILSMNDQAFRDCAFSRQKTAYTRHLAQALQSGEISLEKLEQLDDEQVRSKMITLKGIGNWTIDIYLMFVLRRTDIFPPGDLAAINAYKTLKKKPKDYPKELIKTEMEAFAPYRSMATMLLWHFYLNSRVKR